MVGKNNHIRTVKSNLKEHYKAYKAGRRWVYASLASLALGAGLLLGSTTAFADDAAITTQDPATSVTKDAGSAATVAQTASTVPLKASTTVADTSNTTATDSSNKQATVNTNESANADAKPSDTTPANVGKSANAAAQNTPATTSDSTATKQASTPTADATPATSSSKNQPSSSSKTLVNPTKEQLDAAKKSAEQVYDATHQVQEIDAVAGDPGQTGILTISSSTIGFGTNVKSPLTLTLTVSARAGDVYVVNVPADTPAYKWSGADPLQDQAGTTVDKKNDDGSHTITDTFTNDTTTTQLFKFELQSNYAGQSAGMEDVEKTVTKTITYSINGVEQTPITFTQYIHPTTKLSTVSLLYPDTKKVTKIQPQTNYVFNISVNETTGVMDTSTSTPRVNSAPNYGGSKVIIPVPTGFILDATDTKNINSIDDATTITQPGGKGTEVIIDVPAKSGSQNFQEVKPYRIVGAFDVPQTDTDQTLTASGNVSFTQVVNSDGKTITDSATPWTVIVMGAKTAPEISGVTNSKGNSSVAHNKLVLDADPTDDPENIGSFGFSYNAPGDAKDPKIQLEVPDGLNVTSIQTPTGGVTPSEYLPGTTSYTYTLTLADHTTQTGTVNAGDRVTSTNSSAIRTAVFTPNKLVAGATANDLGQAASFIEYGTLAAEYDDGSPVKNNDQLVSKITFSFDGADGNSVDATSSVTQTVVEPTSLGVGYKKQDSSKPGVTKAGKFQVEVGGLRGQTTYKIASPTFYFVIPTATTVDSVTAAAGSEISQFVADDGHTVVKIDYSGSGTIIDTNKGTGYYGTVNLTNNVDALPGAYPYLMYIVSPTTKLANTTKVVDTSYTEGNANAWLMTDGGKGDWNIVTASSFFNASLAKGNQNTDAVTSGTSDDQGDSTLTFYDSVVYTALEANAKNSNATVMVNLPTVGDDRGSQYTLKLDGPIQVPKDYTVASGVATPINAVVLYSTKLQKVSETDTAPNTAGYVPAGQVTDWSSIKSIIIQVKDIKVNTSTGRIVISGTTDKFNEQAGKIGYLQTIFYGNGAKASINSNDASIKITGTSTIKTRYHYTDNTGADQYIDLDDLSKTLNDNVDTFTNDYPTQLSEFSTTDRALIPTGYKLVTDASDTATPTIIDGTGDGKAAFEQVTQYYYDGDFIQYELVGETSAQVKLVDDNNGGAVVGTPKDISGAPGATANWTMPTIPAGYQLVAGQATSGTYTFSANNQPVLIHVTHILDHSTKTTTRTITYVVDDPNYTNQVPETQTQKIMWKITSDEATGTSFATPTGIYSEQTVPTIKGYTPDKTQIDQEVFNGMATSGIPDDEPVMVTYHADKQQATVEFVDDGKNGAVVGTLTTITGTTSGSANWTADNIPAKYILAKGQAASGTYQFTNGTDQVVKIHLTHVMDYSTATTTRTIMYVVDDPNYTRQVPETQIQKLNWNVVKDTVTGATVATPVGIYSAQTVPTIGGYTADPTTISKEVFDGTTTLPQNEKVEVHYTANAQQVTVEYVDDDNAGAVVGTPTTLTGKTSGTADWNTDNLPAGYQLAKGQAASGTYQFNNTDNQPVQIHLNHIIDNTTATTTRTITYVVDDPNYTGQVPAAKTQTITWNVTTDEVNGASVAVPQSGYSSQNAPEIPGYTPDSATVQAQNYGAAIKGKLPDPETVTVTYTPNVQSAQVEYVDDANGGAVVGNPTTITGKTSGTATWNTDNIPAGYKLAKGQAASGTYQFTNDNQTVQIHLSHIIDNTTATTTRTITYVVDDPNYTGQVPAAKTQTITWNVATDEVNGHMVAIPQSGYAAQTAPALDGYTADPLGVAQQSYAGVTSLPDNETATVTYTPNNQTVTLEYVDDDNDGAVVGTPTTLSGKTSGKVDWNTDNKPTGYSLAAGQAGSGSYQFTTGSDQLIQVHLNHVIEYTTTKTTRTVHFVVDDPNYRGQTPAPMVQTVIWTVATDKATGVSVATPQTGYYEETVPSLPGYTASQTKVGQQALGSVTASDVPMYNEDVVVTYTPDVQTTPSDGEGVPGEPTEPTTPEEPTGTGSITGEIVPETPAPGEAISTTPEKGEKGSATSGNIDENAGYAGTTQDVNGATATVSNDQSKTSAASQGKLPQTNEQSHSEVGLGLLGLLTSMLGLTGLKRRKRDDE